MRRARPKAITHLRALDAEKLRPGDVILTADNSPVSRAIRRSTRSDISHAMIYVESHSIIEADSRGVQARNTQRLHYPSDRALYVLRPQPHLTTAEAEAICTYARSKVGSQYTILEAAQSISPLRGKAGRRQFCSRLIGQAYASAGRDLGGDPDFLSPGDLLRSSAFERLEGVTMQVDAAEAERWADHEDMTAVMVDATNAVLDGVRRLAPNIQTFDDLDAFLVGQPRHDAVVLAAYETSGYLDVWRRFVAAAPWQYDVMAMAEAAQTAAPEIEAYCLDTLRNRGGPERYQNNLAGYTILHQQHGLATFARLRALYGQLLDLHTQRLETALAWLRAYAPSHVSGHKPHTDDWFAALELRDPRQAAMTRQTLGIAGGTDVCTVCGDDPAVDVRLIEVGVPTEASLTLKLCDDCREIRTAAGEQFEEMHAPQRG